MPVCKDRARRVEVFRGLSAWLAAHHISVETMAADLDINLATLRGWLDGTSAPTGPRWHLLRRLYDHVSETNAYPDREWVQRTILSVGEMNGRPSAAQSARVTRAREKLATLRGAKPPAGAPAPDRPGPPAEDALALFTGGGLAAIVRDLSREAQERVARALPADILLSAATERARDLLARDAK